MSKKQEDKLISKLRLIGEENLVNYLIEISPIVDITKMNIKSLVAINSEENLSRNVCNEALYAILVDTEFCLKAILKMLLISGIVAGFPLKGRSYIQNSIYDNSNGNCVLRVGGISFNIKYIEKYSENSSKTLIQIYKNNSIVDSIEFKEIIKSRKVVSLMKLYDNTIEIQGKKIKVTDKIAYRKLECLKVIEDCNGRELINWYTEHYIKEAIIKRERGLSITKIMHILFENIEGYRSCIDGILKNTNK